MTVWAYGAPADLHKGVDGLSGLVTERLRRLERGRFACLWRDASAAVVQLTMSELQLFLEASALVGRVALSPAPFVVLNAEQKNLACPAWR